MTFEEVKASIEANWKDFGFNDAVGCSGIYTVETIKDNDIYKNMQHCETIVKVHSTGKFYSFQWSKDLSDWSDHEYFGEVQEVKKVEIVTTEWQVVKN